MIYWVFTIENWDLMESNELKRVCFKPTRKHHFIHW